MTMSAWRPIGVVAAVAGLAVAMTACGDDDDSASPSVTTVTIQPSSYVVRPPVTTPNTSNTPATADEQGQTDQVQLYVVQRGDYPATIASLYEVDLDALVEFNDWQLVDGIAQGFPGPGTEIRIPPPSKFIDPTDTEETDPPSSEESDPPSTEEASPSTDQVDRCDPGTYVVQADDYPISVAEKLDVSLEALAEANGWTLNGQFYEGFPAEGGTIIVPPASDCT